MRLLALTALAVMLAAAEMSPAWVAAAPAGTAAAPASIEKQPVFHTDNAATTGRTATKPGTSGSFDVMQVVMALSLVLALIFLMRWAGRRMFPGAAAKSTRSIQVMARTSVSPKQSLMLVKVGRRAVLVADCGTQMNALCEISDGEEIAALETQIREEKNESIAKAFDNLFGRAKKTYESMDRPVEQEEKAALVPQEPVEDETALAGIQQEMDGLKEKVRTLSRQFDRP